MTPRHPAANIIDFHTHAFPDALAERAMPRLEAMNDDIEAVLDGKISSLLRSMDAAGIEQSVVASIATKPTQFASILKWSNEIASERLIPFPSLHPASSQALEEVEAVRAEGFKGIKLHPYYQDFHLDEERLFPVYERILDRGLILLCHTGFEIAYPRVRRCGPARVLKVLEAFPELRLVASHLGGWKDWDEVRKHLLGKPIYMELSFSLRFMAEQEARGLLLTHPQDYLLFGTDSPWADQKRTLDEVLSLGLGADREAAILGGNARRLLGLA